MERSLKVLRLTFDWSLRLRLLLWTTFTAASGQSLPANASTTPGGYVQLDAAMKNLTKYEGETVRIKCEITGFPLPRYTWYKDGLPLDKVSPGDPNHFSAKITPWGSRLKIEDMTVDDTGVYVCEGSNSFGKELTRGSVVVRKGANPNRDWLSDLDDGDDLDMNLDVFGENQEHGLTDDGNFKKKIGSKVLPKRPGSKDVDESDGYCQPYRGAACARFVGNRSIYVRTNTEMGNMEESLTARLTIIATTREISQKCAESAIPALCYFAFPLCDSSSRRYRPRKVCLGDCETLQDTLCKSEYDAAARLNSKSDVLPDCLLYADNNENCISIEYASSIGNPYGMDLPDINTEAKEKSVIHIVIPCLAIPICIIVLVVVMCLYRHCQRNETQNKQNQKSTRDQEVMLMKPTIKVRDFPISSIRFLQELGEGSFGRVCRGELVQYAENNLVPIAIKTLRPNSTSGQCTSFWNEAERESELKHPNILLMLGVCSKDQPFCMLFEYFIFGDLHEYLVVHSPNSDISFSDTAGHERRLREVDMIWISNQIANGMEYLSSHGVIHGDVAARNMLIGDGGVVKISDLGISRTIYPLDYYALPGMPPVPVRWMSAEAIQYRKFTTKSDVWSFGVTLWEIFSYGLQPYYGHSNQDVVNLIQGHQILPCPKECPSRFYSLMVECWHQMASHRSNFHDIHQRLCQWHSENNFPGIEVSRTNRPVAGLPFNYGQCGQASQQSSTGNSNNTTSTMLGGNQTGHPRDVFSRSLMVRPPHLPPSDHLSSAEAQLVIGTNQCPAVDSELHQVKHPVVLFKKSSSSASSGASQMSASNAQFARNTKNRQPLVQAK